LSRNMDYIVYLNKFVDYKTYHSYSEVQLAVLRKEIDPDPPEYRSKKSCRYCGKEIIKLTPGDTSNYCNQACRNALAYRKRQMVKLESGFIVEAPKPTGRPAKKVWEHIADILPLYNDGKSDFYISNRLGLSDKYILKIRRFFGIPANHGKPPERTYSLSQLDYNPGGK